MVEAVGGQVVVLVVQLPMMQSKRRDLVVLVGFSPKTCSSLK